MKVLIVNQYFPPDQSATAEVFFDLAKVLVQRGHTVTVLCGRPSYIRAPSADGPGIPAGVRVLRVASTSFSRSRLSGRLSNYISYLILAALRGLFLTRHDVVVSGTDPPLAIWAAICASRRTPLVYSVQDLHPDLALQARWVKRGPLTSVWERFHRAGMTRAQRVVCITEPMTHKVIEKGVKPSRVTVVHNGGRIPDQTELDPVAVGAVRNGGSFVVVHAGNLGATGPWKTMHEVVNQMADQVRFVFFGEGPGADVLRSPAVVLPFKPFDQLASVMAAGDLQLVATAKGMDELMFPSKLYTALAFGRPVLAVTSDASEVATIIRTYRCGLVADSEDPDSVVTAIRWARDNPAELRLMGDRALAASPHFKRSKCMHALAEIVEQIVTSTAPAS